VLAGAVVATALLLPYRSTTVTRSDGVEIRIPSPAGLAHLDDVWDYLQLGRQVYEGQGLTDLISYAPLLPEATRPGHSVTAFPLLSRPPGYPLLLAAAFTLSRGANPDAMLLVLAAGVILLPIFTWLLARRVVDDRWARFAGLAALLSPVALGIHEALAVTTLFAAVMALCSLAMLSVSTIRGYLLAGLLLGLAAMLRQETALVLPGLLITFAAPRKHDRVRGLIIMITTMIAVMIPWQFHLAQLTGSWFYNSGSLLLHNTDAFPGWTSSRTLAVRDVTTLGFLSANFASVLAKTGKNFLFFAIIVMVLPSAGAAPLMWAGMAGLRRNWRSVLRERSCSNEQALLLGTLVSATTIIVVLSPLEFAPRFLAAVIPGLAVTAAVGISRLNKRAVRSGGRAGSRTRTMAATVSIIAAATLVCYQMAKRPHDGTAEQAVAHIAALPSEYLTPGSVALSDAPAVYAWIWKRPAIWAPVPGDIAEIRTMIPNVFAVSSCVPGPSPDLNGDIVSLYANVGGIVVRDECPKVVVFSDSSPATGVSP